MRVYIWVTLLFVAGCRGGATGGNDGGGGASGGGGGGNAPLAVASCSDAVVGLRIACDGTQSSDPAGRALSYAWSLTGWPAPTPQMASGSGSTFSFAPAVGGTYEVTLTVSTPDG